MKHRVGYPFWGLSILCFSAYNLWRQLRDFSNGEEHIFGVWFAIAFASVVTVAVGAWWISNRSRLSRSLKISSVIAAVLIVMVAAFGLAIEVMLWGTCTLGDCQNGYGKFTWTAAGETYEGDWRDGKREGQGTGTFVDRFKYTGEWKDDTPDGWGTSSWPNGDVYVGEHSGFPHGRGTKTHSDGRVESGLWALGRLVEEER